MPKRKRLTNEPIDLTVDTPPKASNSHSTANANACANASSSSDATAIQNNTSEDEIIITKVVPPPAVVITSYTPAEKSTQQTVLGLMADIMGKVSSHNSRNAVHSSILGTYSQRKPLISPKKPNNAPAKISAQESTDPSPPSTLRCAICLSTFSKYVQLSATICGHIFCQECIGAALKQGKKICPICRKDLKGKTAVHRLYI